MRVWTKQKEIQELVELKKKISKLFILIKMSIKFKLRKMVKNSKKSVEPFPMN